MTSFSLGDHRTLTSITQGDLKPWADRLSSLTQAPSSWWGWFRQRRGQTYRERLLHAALLLACEHGHQEVVDLTLPYVNLTSVVTTDDAYTPLMVAAKFGQRGVVQRLLPISDPLYVSPTDGFTALLCAAWWGDLDGIKDLLPHSDALHLDLRGNSAMSVCWTSTSRIRGPNANGSWTSLDLLAFHESDPCVIKKIFEYGGPQRMPMWHAHVEAELLKITLATMTEQSNTSRTRARL